MIIIRSTSEKRGLAEDVSNKVSLQDFMKKVDKKKSCMAVYKLKNAAIIIEAWYPAYCGFINGGFQIYSHESPRKGIRLAFPLQTISHVIRLEDDNDWNEDGTVSSQCRMMLKDGSSIDLVIPLAI